MISKACGVKEIGVKEIDDLGPAIYRAMSYDLDSWQHPYNELPISRAKKRQRIEFYSWLGGLEPGARVIRYGCESRLLCPSSSAPCSAARRTHGNPGTRRNGLHYSVQFVYSKALRAVLRMR
jgi:hypothetical protein